MRRFAAASFSLALLAVPAAARADLFSSVSAGVHASTIGHGITLEKPLLFDFSVRVTTGTLSVSQQSTYDTTSYTTTTRYSNVGVIADYRPYAGRYRISGGLVFGNDRIDNVSRDAAGFLRVGNNLYPVSGTGTVNARVRFDRPSLYAGVGTGAGLVRGLALEFDAGALVRNGTATAVASGPLANDPAFRADLQRLRGELRTHIVVPVLSVGLIYRP
jgi:opacity protein-like surface antigen